MYKLSYTVRDVVDKIFKREEDLKHNVNVLPLFFDAYNR